MGKGYIIELLAPDKFGRSVVPSRRSDAQDFYRLDVNAYSVLDPLRLLLPPALEWRHFVEGGVDDDLLCRWTSSGSDSNYHENSRQALEYCRVP